MWVWQNLFSKYLCTVKNTPKFEIINLVKIFSLQLFLLKAHKKISFLKNFYLCESLIMQDYSLDSNVHSLTKLQLCLMT